MISGSTTSLCSLRSSASSRSAAASASRLGTWLGRLASRGITSPRSLGENETHSAGVDHRARSVMVMAAYFRSLSGSFSIDPPGLAHPVLTELADQHMPPGEETSSWSPGQNSLSFPSGKRTSMTTYSFPRSNPQPRRRDLCALLSCGALAPSLAYLLVKPWVSWLRESLGVNPQACFSRVDKDDYSNTGSVCTELFTHPSPLHFRQAWSPSAYRTAWVTPISP